MGGFGVGAAAVMTVIVEGLPSRVCDEYELRVWEPVVMGIAGGRAHEPLHIQFGR